MLQLPADGGAAGVVMEAMDEVENGAAETALTQQPSIEDARSRRERWRSVYIIYFTMFQMSLGFSIVLTGVWPYLDKASLTAFAADASNYVDSVQGIGIWPLSCSFGDAMIAARDQQATSDRVPLRVLTSKYYTN